MTVIRLKELKVAHTVSYERLAEEHHLGPAGGGPVGGSGMPTQT